MQWNARASVLALLVTHLALVKAARDMRPSTPMITNKVRTGCYGKHTINAIGASDCVTFMHSQTNDCKGSVSIVIAIALLSLFHLIGNNSLRFFLAIGLWRTYFATNENCVFIMEVALYRLPYIE